MGSCGLSVPPPPPPDTGELFFVLFHFISTCIHIHLSVVTHISDSAGAKGGEEKKKKKGFKKTGAEQTGNHFLNIRQTVKNHERALRI